MHEVDKASDELMRLARRYCPDTMIFGMVIGFEKDGILGQTIVGGVTIDAFAWGVARLMEAGQKAYGISFLRRLQEECDIECDESITNHYITTVAEIREENKREAKWKDKHE